MKHLSLITVMLLTTGGRIEADDALVFIKTHCVKCHGARKSSGDLRLDVVMWSPLNTANVELWQAIVDRRGDTTTAEAGPSDPGPEISRA